MSFTCRFRKCSEPGCVLHNAGQIEGILLTIRLCRALDLWSQVSLCLSVKNVFTFYSMFSAYSIWTLEPCSKLWESGHISVTWYLCVAEAGFYENREILTCVFDWPSLITHRGTHIRRRMHTNYTETYICIAPTTYAHTHTPLTLGFRAATRSWNYFRKKAVYDGG